jgi:catechol 2,3-dioxygenase-like lactoylglutathione lyase family enzyme
VRFCLLSQLLAALTLIFSSVGCSDSGGTDLGRVRGRVRTQDGSELKQVTVRSGDKSAKTDADGYFTLEVKAGQERRVAVDSKEFAGGDALVKVGKGDVANLELGVMQVRTLKVEDAEKGGQFEDEDGFSLKLPERALRGPDGSVTKGRAEIRYASVRDAKLMRVPPELRARDEQGRELRLKSQGLLEVRFYSGDAQLEIKGEAEVKVPLPSSSNLKAGDRIGLYHYDTATGRFKREAEAEVQDGKWVAKLDKFSWWTIADAADATGCVTAQLHTPADEPASGVVATAVGINELWLSSAVTNEAGELCLEAPSGDSVEVSAFWSDGDDSGVFRATAEVPAGSGMCGGDGCEDLGSQQFSGADQDAGADDSGTEPALFRGLMDTKTAEEPGEIVTFAFTAAGGERLAYTLSSSAGVASDIRLLGPDGERLQVGSSTVSAGASIFVDAFVIRAGGGEYTLQVTPRNGTGSFTVDLFGVPEEAADSIVADGEPSTIAVTSVAQNAVFTFDAQGGERLAYTVDSSADTATDLRLIGPAGNRLAVGAVTVSSGAHGFADQFVLPAVAGEYRIEIDPREQGTGSFDLALVSVPDDVVTDVTIDGPQASLSLPSLAQNGAFRLRNASGGERLAYTISNAGATVADSVLLDPSDNVINSARSTTSAGSSSFHDAFVLPSAAGDYLFTIDPRDEAAGSDFTFELISVPPDATAPLTIGAGPTSLTLGSVGQNGAYVFSASGGERVAITVQSSADNVADLVVVDPNGQMLAGTSRAISSNATIFVDAFTLPALAGSYELRVDPRGQATGGFVANLFSVPADPTSAGSLQSYANVTNQALATSVAGQNAAIDVTTTAPNEVVAYYVTNSASNVVDVELRAPGGVLVGGSNRAISSNTTGFVDAFSLGAAGTYRLVIDPREQGTGTITVRFFAVAPARLNASVTPNAAGPTRLDVTIPGQVAAFSFALTAGQVFNYSVTRAGSSVADTRLLDPSQRAITPSGGAVVSSAPLNVTGVTAPATGTYTLEVDPRTDNVDAYNVILTSP